MFNFTLFLLLLILLIAVILSFHYIHRNKKDWQKFRLKVKFSKLLEIDIEAENHEKYKKKGPDANDQPRI